MKVLPQCGNEGIVFRQPTGRMQVQERCAAARFLHLGLRAAGGGLDEIRLHQATPRSSLSG